jgi:hypothetical protein
MTTTEEKPETKTFTETKKRKDHAFGKDVYLLGWNKYHERIWLEAAAELERVKRQLAARDMLIKQLEQEIEAKDRRAKEATEESAS